MSVRGDGRDHISDRFYVDGIDETRAPELAGMGRRRLIGAGVALVVFVVIGLLWTGEVGTGIALAGVFVFQAGVVVFFAAEHAAVRAIHKRHLADPTVWYHPQTVQEDAVAYLVGVSDARQGWAKGLAAAAILAGLFAFDRGGWWWAVSAHWSWRRLCAPTLPATRSSGPAATPGGAKPSPCTSRPRRARVAARRSTSRGRRGRPSPSRGCRRVARHRVPRRRRRARCA